MAFPPLWVGWPLGVELRHVTRVTVQIAAGRVLVGVAVSKTAGLLVT